MVIRILYIIFQITYLTVSYLNPGTALLIAPALKKSWTKTAGTMQQSQAFFAQNKGGLFCSRIGH